jgi:hypothetical protein
MHEKSCQEMWIQVELNICRATICNGFWFALFNYRYAGEKVY